MAVNSVTFHKRLRVFAVQAWFLFSSLSRTRWPMTSGAARGRTGANRDTRSPSASSKKAQGASLRGTFPSCPGGCLDLVPACVSSWFGGCLKPAEDDTCSYPSACWSIVYANSCDGVVHSMCKSTRELKNRFCAVRVALHSLSLQCKLHLMIAPGKLYSRNPSEIGALQKAS